MSVLEQVIKSWDSKRGARRGLWLVTVDRERAREVGSVTDEALASDAC